MATRELPPPTEFPKRQPGSRPRELERWAEFLQPRDLELYRAVRDAIGVTLAKKPVSLGGPANRWTDGEFMDYVLNVEYPIDIEERIEESWRR